MVRKISHRLEEYGLSYLFALVGTALGLLLLIAATGGFTGRRWAKTVRTVAYVPLVTLCVLASPLVIELLKAWFRS